MLAERKVKIKWSTDPQNTHWTNDKNKFGYKMLQKMGWSEGKGLGVSEDGALEHIKVKTKYDTSGLGVKKGRDDDWIAGQEEFDDILATLNSQPATIPDSLTTENDEDLSHHEIKGIVPNSLKRLSYKKTIGSKDLSKKSDKEISCVLGKRRKLTRHKKEAVVGSSRKAFLRIKDANEESSSTEKPILGTTSPS